MSAVSTWSTTAGSNNSASPDGFPEQMPPGGVNDSAREVMAAIRTWYEDAQWINYGYTHTYGSATTFTVAEDITADYTAGRRLRAIAVTPGTIYGTITDSTYGAPNTTVTVEWDGTELSNEAITSVSIHINSDGFYLNGSALTLDGDADLVAIADTDDRLDVELATKPVFSVDATEADSVNGVEVIAGATGNPGKIRAQGDDTNVNLHLLGKGTGEVYGASMRENMIINGDMRIDQRSGRGPHAASTTLYPNNDDTYVMDRWVLLSDGNDRVDIDVSDTITPYWYAEFSTETVGSPSEKYGICQIIEYENIQHALQDGKVSVSFDARTENLEVENVRVHVLEWSGTKDVVTSDVVSAWNNEGSNPTFAGSWSAANTAANLALTNSWQTFSVEDITVSSSTTNLAVFIHVDDTDLIANDRWFLSNVQLVAGALSLPFQYRSVSEELQRCQRFYCKTYEQTAAIGSDNNLGTAAVNAVGTAAGNLLYYWQFPVVMRTAPTVSTYSKTGTADKWSVGGVDDIASTTNQESDRGVRLVGNAAPVDATIYHIHAVADAEL